MTLAHDYIKGEVRDIRLPAKKQVRISFFEGDDLCKTDGKRMKKSRTVDKNNDQYTEIITNPETGEVIRCCIEPLSEHTGHGSAKKKKND